MRLSNTVKVKEVLFSKLPKRSEIWEPDKAFEITLGKTSNTTLRILSVKGWGGTPQIRNPLFAEKLIRKGGEGGTPQIRNIFFGPKSGVFFSKKHHF